MVNDLDPSPAQGSAALSVHAADVSSAAGVAGLFEAVQRELGGLDILVNNAAVWFREPFRDISEEHWDKVFGTIVKGAFLCLQKAAALMEDAGGGSVVNIASQAGLSYTRGQGVHYHAAKAALIHLTRAVAFELGPLHIRVNAVAPGYTETEGRAVEGDRRQRLLDQTPLGRPVRPADVSAAVMFLCSDSAAAITGQTLLVNGGAIAYL